MKNNLQSVQKLKRTPINVVLFGENQLQNKEKLQAKIYTIMQEIGKEIECDNVFIANRNVTKFDS